MATETITLRMVMQDMASGNISRAISGLDKMAQRGGLMGSVMQGVGIQFGMMLNPMNLMARGLGTVQDYMSDAIDKASDLAESTSKVQYVFEKAGEEALDWADDLDSAYGISKQAALEAIGTFGNFIQALGGSEDAALDMSKRLVQLAGDLASFNNVARDDVLVALRAGLAGETEPMRRLGADISVARLEAMALAEGMTLVNGKLNEAQKLELRYKAILKDTVKAQGDAVRTADSLAGSQRELAAETDNLAAEIGTHLLPYQQKWNEAILYTLELLDDLGNAGGETGDKLIMDEQNARRAFEELATNLGISFDELSARIIAASNKGARSFATQMEHVDEVGRDVLAWTVEQNQEWARAQDYMPLVAKGLERVADSGDEAADALTKGAKALQFFKTNADDFADVRTVEKVNKAIARQTKAIKEAAEAGDYAAVARHKARRQELNQERETSVAARKAFEESQRLHEEREQRIRHVAKVAGVSEEKVRKELRKTGLGIQGVKDKLLAAKTAAHDLGAEDPTVTVTTPGLASAITDFRTLVGLLQSGMAIRNITYTVTASGQRNPHLGRGTNANYAEGSAAAGGYIPAHATYLVGEKGPELLSMGNQGGWITPNHALGGASFVYAPQYSTASPEEARRFASAVGPHIARWMRSQ